MMLPGDMAFLQDKKYKEWVEKYAKDNDLFFKDFAAVIQKLFELGVPSPRALPPTLSRPPRSNRSSPRCCKGRMVEKWQTNKYATML